METQERQIRPVLKGLYSASRYNIWVPVGGGSHLLFNSRTRGLLILSPSEAIAARSVLEGLEGDSSLHEQVKAQLERNGMLLPVYVDEMRMVESAYLQQRHAGQALAYTIMSTTACNFGCDYCFQGEHKPNTVIQESVVDDVGRRFSAAPRGVKAFHVTWYGGEPLLAIRSIESASKKFLAIADSKRVAYTADIVTNGHALNEKVFQTLLAAKVRTAQITLDGPREAHDLRRKLLKGTSGTFDKIVNNIRANVGKGIHFSIRVNVDVRNWLGVADLLDYLAAAGLGVSCGVSVYFARVEAITDACSTMAEHALGKETYAACETKLRRIATSYGLADYGIPQPFAGICGALRPDSFVVLPEGSLHKCWDTISDARQSVGHLGKDSSDEQETMRQQWEGFSPFANPVCRRCNVLPLCGGACAHKTINSEQGSNGAEVPCPSFRFNLEDRLVDIASASGALGR